MARLEFISIDDAFCRSQLEQFKQYASVPDDSRDALLGSMLKSAVLKVQEFADVALATCECRQTQGVPASGIIRLYLGGGDVVELKDQYGNDVPFDPLPGGRLQLFTRDCTVSVTFKTSPNAAELERLTSTVFRYATALYDGEDAGVLREILNEVR